MPPTPTRSRSRRTRPAARPRLRSRAAAQAFERLIRIMATLRGPHGCAWDRKQTHESLRGYLIEETYEAVSAIDAGDLDQLRGELGDVLLQCVFHAQLAREAGRFDIADVVRSIADKLVRRHPHVFRPDGRPLSARDRARAGASTPDAVKEQWARIKASEQSDAGQTARVLSGVPRALPALLRAHKIGARVASVGFDWPTAADVITKVEEEVAELRGALRESQARAAEELGDLLFALANFARKLGIEPEAALSAANDKFTSRFDAVERWFESQGRDVHTASLDEMEEAWTRVKREAARGPASGAQSTSVRSPRGRRSRLKSRRRDRSGT